MPLLDASILFILGTIVGSFINALAFRYNTGLSMWGRSACLSCARVLGAIDLVPVLSYLGLLGRCRTCRVRISPQYPIVEITAGLLAVLSYMAAGGAIVSFVLLLALWNILLFIAVYDFRHTIIPNVFVYTAAGLSLLYAYLSLGGAVVPQHILAGVLLALIPALLFFVSGGTWVGLGDAKLFLAGGFLLGVGQGIAAFMVAFWMGAIVALVWMGIAALTSKVRGVTMKSEVPFGPFIIVAFALCFFADIAIADILAVLSFI